MGFFCCFAVLVHCLANNVGDWDDICALMANCLIALYKCPDFQPTGTVGALDLQVILGKVVTLVTHSDHEEIYGIAQLCSGLHLGVGWSSSCSVRVTY